MQKRNKVSCNGCGIGDWRAPMYGCRSCGYDLCHACAIARVRTMYSANAAAYFTFRLANRSQAHKILSRRSFLRLC